MEAAPPPGQQYKPRLLPRASRRRISAQSGPSNVSPETISRAATLGMIPSDYAPSGRERQQIISTKSRFASPYLTGCGAISDAFRTRRRSGCGRKTHRAPAPRCARPCSLPASPRGAAGGGSPGPVANFGVAGWSGMAVDFTLGCRGAAHDPECDCRAAEASVQRRLVG